MLRTYGLSAQALYNTFEQGFLGKTKVKVDAGAGVPVPFPGFARI